MKLDAGMTVLKIANHASLWAEAQFYESQLRYIREGTPVRIEVDAFPGRRWSGRVAYFDPHVNPQTRTLTAFVEVDNRDMKLRPQMFAEISVPIAQVAGAVRVPSEAVVRSGERSVVIVQKSPGLFDPREVELGAEGGGYQEIRKGVAAGEMVVTSSQFLIDSESNLKAAIGQMLGGGESGAAEPASPPAHVH
jgi:Cu(I)/Ag(I) efflux system membrane fusion protein